MKILTNESTDELSLQETKQRIPLVEAVNMGVKYNEQTKRQDFKHFAHRLLIRNWRQKKKEFWAIKGVTFAAYPGDILGIIGSNGAGKTTLCRALSGLLRPDMGSVKINGKVSSLLSLGTGFNNELSGRNNILLNGMMLGFSRKQVEALLPSIEDFAGLGNFMDQPIKYYSKGMRARLGFSIAATLKAEILIIDEVLSTGDLEFRRQAAKKMRSLVEKANLVIVVSHSLDFVEENCTRALWIDNGEIKASGKPGEVTALYKEKVAVKPKNKKIVNLKKTKVEKGEEESIGVENLGLSYSIDKKPFWALRDVTFSVRDKEIVGIIGSNGAGKSTLCQTLCGILREDEGSKRINGEIAALLSFGTGFNPQLSGRDNISLNGLMLGFTKKEMKALENDILEFSELGKHIDKPVKNYSSGMKARLGFSIAAMLQPDIFVVDEALSAGDIAFQEKATTRMQEMLGDAKTVLIVTHSLKLVKRVCTRALWFNKGELKYDGDPKNAIGKYKRSIAKNK